MTRDHAPEFDVDAAHAAHLEQLRIERERRGFRPAFVPSSMGMLEEAAMRHEARRFSGASLTNFGGL